jgi:hypothetical protein
MMVYVEGECMLKTPIVCMLVVMYVGCMLKLTTNVCWLYVVVEKCGSMLVVCVITT